MGFALEANGALAPTWPHIICAGAADLSGRGWAWHDDESRRPCFVAEVAAPADLVAAAIDGRELAGIDRLLAIARLREEIPGGLQRVFCKECPACGGNHLERAARAIRAVKLIHPDAIEALRQAKVPESLLCEPYRRKKGAQGAVDPAKGERQSRAKGLTVWLGDFERTRLAQIAFASQYALRAGRATRW